MASINTIVKRKQYLWLGIVVVGTASAIGGALYLSDVDMSGNGETVAEQEPVPDMTGVVDIRRLANYARQRGDMVVIYDRSGEFVKSYYDPSIDKILNPLDARCAAWDLWKECLTQPDFDNTANTLIPMGTKEDPFWQGSGRTIFAEAAYLMRNDPNRSYSKLVDTLLSIKIEKLRTFLRNSPAANLVEEKIEKTAISIRAVLTNYVKAIRYLQGIEHNGESFTIRDWMRGVREDQKNGWLFISSNADRATY